MPDDQLCRICHAPAERRGAGDHETVCMACCTDALIDAYLAGVPDSEREDAIGRFYTERDERRAPGIRIEELRFNDEMIPLPDDLAADELAMLLSPLLDEMSPELRARLGVGDDELDDEEDDLEAAFDADPRPILRPSPAWYATQFPALRGELHRPSPTPDEIARAHGIDLPDEYPGFRHFRVIESVEVDGERTWTIRDVYRKG